MNLNYQATQANGRKKIRKKQKTFYLPPALIARLRLYAAQSEQSQSEIVEQALNDFLNRRGELF